MELIEAYYMVAADLKGNADELRHVAERLAKVADRMSEELAQSEAKDEAISEREE